MFWKKNIILKVFDGVWKEELNDLITICVVFACFNSAPFMLELWSGIVHFIPSNCMEYLDAKKWGARLIFLSEIFGRRSNERQSWRLWKGHLCPLTYCAVQCTLTHCGYRENKFVFSTGAARAKVILTAGKRPQWEEVYKAFWKSDNSQDHLSCLHCTMQ